MSRNYTFQGLNMTAAATLAEAVEQYGMDFPVLKLPLYYKDQNENLIVSPYHEQILNGETYLPLGVVGLRYTTVEYPIAFSPAEALITGGARIVGGGCPNRGERAYLILESDGVIQLSPGDTIVNRFLMLSSHDGTGKIEIRMTPWREFTGTAITFNATNPLAFKHTRRVETKVSRARKIFNQVNNNWAEFSDGVKRMVSINLTEREAKDFIEMLLPPSGDEPSTRIENIWSQILTVYRDTGIGTRMPQCRGTLFGLVQAVTEWADIKRTVRKSNKRDEEAAALDARLISDSARKKQRAWALALALSKNKKLSGALK